MQVPYGQYMQYGFINPMGQMTSVQPPPGFNMGSAPNSSATTGLLGLGHGQSLPANLVVTPPNSTKNSDTSVSAVTNALVM